MAVTKEELEGFHDFATKRVDNGGAESLAELLSEWLSRREYRETVAEVSECIADMEAGVGRPLDEVDAELRAKHGFAPAKDS